MQYPLPYISFADDFYYRKVWDGCLARTYPLLRPQSECPCVLFVAGSSPDKPGEGHKVGGRIYIYTYTRTHRTSVLYQPITS